MLPFIPYETCLIQMVLDMKFWKNVFQQNRLVCLQLIASCCGCLILSVLSVLRESDDDLHKLVFLTRSADWKPNTTLEVRQEKFQGSKTLRLKMVNWIVLFELHGHWTINREKTTGNILEISRRFCH